MAVPSEEERHAKLAELQARYGAEAGHTEWEWWLWEAGVSLREIMAPHHKRAREEREKRRGRGTDIES